MRRVTAGGLLVLVGCGGAVSSRDNISEGSSGQSAGGARSHAPTETPPSVGGANPVGSGKASCWYDSLPAEPQPIPLAEADFGVACKTALATSGTISSAGAGSGDDNQGLLIGRFQTCGAATLVPSPHDVVEFGSNRRYRLLQRDPATGELHSSEVVTSTFFAVATST